MWANTAAKSSSPTLHLLFCSQLLSLVHMNWKENQIHALNLVLNHINTLLPSSLGGHRSTQSSNKRKKRHSGQEKVSFGSAVSLQLWHLQCYKSKETSFTLPISNSRAFHNCRLESWPTGKPSSAEASNFYSLEHRLKVKQKIIHMLVYIKMQTKFQYMEYRQQNIWAYISF